MGDESVPVLKELYLRRSLVMAFARRDVATRYRASYLGWLWSLAQPLATLLIFAAVFAIIFQVEAPPLGNGQGSSYAAFLFTGLVTWNLFSSQPRLAMHTLLSCRDLIHKVQFPAWAPILGASVVQLVQVLLEFCVLVLMLLSLRNVSWTWLLAVPILLGTALFAQGIALLVTAIFAHVGDVEYVVAVFLGILYFLTPILYPVSMIEGQVGIVAWAIRLNPMSWYVQGMHDVMYSLTSPPWWSLWGMLIGGFAMFWTGLSIFRWASRNLGELI